MSQINPVAAPPAPEAQILTPEAQRLTPEARILMIGAGHANLIALPILRASCPHARITVVEPATSATYSGMLPGFVAGHYSANQLSVDLGETCARLKVELIHGAVTGINLAAKEVQVETAGAGPQSVPYDLAALDIGSHSVMPEIEGFAAHGIAVKPLGAFADRWSAFDARVAQNAPMCVIGGGVAGAEVALAMAHRRGAPVTLIEAGDQIAPHLAPRARAVLLAAMARQDVRAVLGQRVARIAADHVILADGRRIESAFTLGAAGARPYAWLARDLAVNGAGFVEVGATLQMRGEPTLFATGDCAAMTHAPRPKAGVFAVRQGPVLAANLAAMLRGEALTEYHPQRDYLKLISLGGKRALCDWHGITLHGAWLWRLKDWIDRGFMAKVSR